METYTLALPTPSPSPELPTLNHDLQRRGSELVIPALDLRSAPRVCRERGWDSGKWTHGFMVEVVADPTQGALSGKAGSIWAMVCLCFQ